MSKNKNLNDCLITAVGEGKLQKVKELMNSLCSSSIDSIKDKEGLTPLCIAIDRGHFDIVECLVSHGFSVNSPALKDGYMSLHFAVKRDNKEIAKLLVSCGADVNAKGKNGITPLHIAAEKGFYRIANFLLKQGADPNSVLSASDTETKKYLNKYLTKGGYTPLHIAVRIGYDKIVQLLLDHGASFNTQGKDCINGKFLTANALHIACLEGHSNVVKVLVKSGAPVNFKDAKGYTALHYAVRKGFSGIIDILLTSSIDLECKDAYGRTALHVAVEGNFLDGVWILLKNEADIECRDLCGRTPLHVASEEGHCNVVEMLVKYGADINSLTKYNHVPLDFGQFDICYENDGYSFSNKKCHYTYDRWSFNREQIAKYLKWHIVKMKTANLYVCEKNLQSIADNKDMIGFGMICENEMLTLSAKKITSNVTVQDIVTKSENQLAAYAQNKEVVNFFKSYDFSRKFPIYSNLISLRFREGVERNELLKRCYEFFYSRYKLPSEITDEIIVYLSNRDIRVFTETFRYGNFSIHNIEELHKSLNIRLN